MPMIGNMVRRKAKRKHRAKASSDVNTTIGGEKQAAKEQLAKAGSGTSGGEARPLVLLRSWPFWLWVVCVGLIGAFFLILKMFGMKAYAGDEHIYLFQAKLISEGVRPYSDFAMAHPPLQSLFAAAVLKVFGYQFILGRFLPVIWCLSGGIALAFMVRRELGSIASVASAGLYLLAYEPLRASTHFTGVNMTVALLVMGFYAYRRGSIRTAAMLCAAAVFTRLYAAPGVLVLVLWAMAENRRNGLRLIAWGAGAGLLGAIGVGLWAGFSDTAHNLFLYHVQKTAMDEGSLETMRNNVLFHNFPLVALFVLAQPVLLAVQARAYNRASTKRGITARFFDSVVRSDGALVALSTWVAVLFLVVLLSLDRVWMYYFVPSFPFAAVAGGWLISKWAVAAWALVRARGNLGEAGMSRATVAGGGILGALFVLCLVFGPRLERNLDYFAREMEKAPEDRVHTYQWSPDSFRSLSIRRSGPPSGKRSASSATFIIDSITCCGTRAAFWMWWTRSSIPSRR